MTVGGTSLACGRGTSRPPRSLARATVSRTSYRRGSWLARGHEIFRVRGRGWRRLSAAGLTAPWMETTARQRRPRSGSHTVGSCPGHRDGATLKPQPPHPSLRSSDGNCSDGRSPAGGIMSDDDGMCGASSPRSPTCGASACSGQTPLFGSTPACSGTPHGATRCRTWLLHTHMVHVWCSMAASFVIAGDESTRAARLRQSDSEARPHAR